MADKQGSPVTFLSAVPVPANTTSIVAFPAGYRCINGITWSASGTGMNGYIVGRQ